MTQRKICLRSGRIEGTRRIQRRKVNSKLAPFMHFAVNVDKAAMTLHDRQRSRKAETCSFRHFFCGEEWFKDPALNFLIHSRSRIGHADNHKASCPGLDVHARI